MIKGYVREISDQQNLKLQLRELKKIGCRKIYQDKGDSVSNRPEMERMIRDLKNGEVVVTWRMDCIGKSLKDLIELINLYKEIGANFVSIEDHIDTRKKQHKIFYTGITALSRFEKPDKIESNRGISFSSGRKNRKGGRPRGLSGDSIIKARRAKQLYESDNIPISDISRSLGIGRTTLYRYLRYSGAEVVNKKESRHFLPEQKPENKKVRLELFRKLNEAEAFWSYPHVSFDKLSDDMFIQKVMEQLDIEEIQQLFRIYNKDYIRKVWKDQMVIQDPYYRSLNILLAKLFFNIKNPEKYISKVKHERSQ